MLFSPHTKPKKKYTSINYIYYFSHSLRFIVVLTFWCDTHITPMEPNRNGKRAMQRGRVTFGNGFGKFQNELYSKQHFSQPHTHTHSHTLSIHKMPQHINMYLIFSKWFSVNLWVYSTYTVLVMIFCKYTRGFNSKALPIFMYVQCTYEKECVCVFFGEIIHRSIIGLKMFWSHGLYNIHNIIYLCVFYPHTHTNVHNT